MENHSNNTLHDINRQLYFDFALNLELELTEEERSLMHLFENLDFSKFKTCKSGRKAKVSPYNMAVIVVYGYMIGKGSTRDIEYLTRRDMFLRALLGPITAIDHSTIDRFITKNLDAIEDLFYQVVRKIGEHGELSKSFVFQDGTKIESRAGKYTFVWKRCLEKNIGKTIKRMIGYCQRAKGLGLLSTEAAVNEDTCFSFLSSIISGYSEQDLLQALKSTGRGRGHKADPVNKLLKEAVADIQKLKEQENRMVLIGDGRKSLSKTDTDATFMRMKEDYMGNGQLKPAYNIQNAVDSGYIVGSTISSDRTDYSTCIPTMETLNEKLDWSYSSYVADSGYDCNENFRYLEGKGVKAYIKPQDWEISKKRSYRNDIGKYQNMEYSKEEDYFICANSRKLFPTGKTRRRGKAIYKEYRCNKGCKSCPFRSRCVNKAKTEYKTFSLDNEHWEYRKKAYDLLQTQEGIEARVNRSIQAEGSFAQLKANMGKRRFNCFGKKRVFIEWLLFALALNIKTFASRMRKGKIGSPQWFIPPAEETA